MTTLSSLSFAPQVDDGQAVAALARIAGAADRMGEAAGSSEQRVTRGTASFDAIERRAVRYVDAST